MEVEVKLDLCTTLPLQHLQYEAGRIEHRHLAMPLWTLSAVRGFALERRQHAPP